MQSLNLTGSKLEKNSFEFDLSYIAMAFKLIKSMSLKHHVTFKCITLIAPEKNPNVKVSAWLAGR